MKINGQSEVLPIDSILLKHPRDAFLSQKNVDSQWQQLNYLGCPDYSKAIDEYEKFLDLLGRQVSHFHFLPQSASTGLDSIYLHDPVVITKKGAVLCSMGKTERRSEPALCGEFLESIGVPMLGAITGEGLLEGGDVVWLDEKTLAVGQGYRTNAEGIRQLKELTAGLVDEFVVVPLPHWDGSGDVLHLMSMLSPVDTMTAVVYSRLMPVPFRQWLLQRGMTLLEVPDEEYASMACNILAVAPGKCLMLAGNPMTRKVLEDNGIEVWEYKGEEMSLKGAGGPTCLTRPLLRAE